ncbi:MAG: HlyD family efflux transporter periplasmic adaptor subunit [Bacteroidales bacterium]|jgi:HlyD family secretion protein|nr:HlyD family efflux transporter periplasmic adaptor subunit [Bacteroidales bacterium]
MEEHNKIELRSTEVQEILSRPPRWMVRWGITIVFVVVAILVTGSWFFKYPDIIPANIVLTTENPPAPVVAKTSGKIQNLFVADKQNVQQEDVLAVLENPARYESIITLEDLLDGFNADFQLGEPFLLTKYPYELGSVQSFYANFVKNIEAYNQMIRLNYHDQKIGLYQQELKKYGKYLAHLEKQNRLLGDDFHLAQKQFLRDSALNAQNMLSDADFEQSKSQLIAKQYSLEQNSASIASIHLQTETLKQNILELELQKKQQLSDFQSQIEESYKNLQAAIDSWKYQYTLVSHTNGKVTFNQYWNENQSVKAGETVMTVIPDDEGKIIGKVQLTFQGAGKVKPGQQANIQFANYPYMEFGMVKGTVQSIALAPNNNFYTAEINLPNGLTTFYGIELDFKQQMTGKAEIITEDIRLLERIVRPLRYILKKNTNLGN